MRSKMATRAPTAANAFATAAPMPLAPPVTTATSPSRRNSVSGSVTGDSLRMAMLASPGLPIADVRLRNVRGAAYQCLGCWSGATRSDSVAIGEEAARAGTRVEHVVRENATRFLLLPRDVQARGEAFAAIEAFLARTPTGPARDNT